jgi:hypothetical protein
VSAGERQYVNKIIESAHSVTDIVTEISTAPVARCRDGLQVNDRGKIAAGFSGSRESGLLVDSGS